MKTEKPLVATKGKSFAGSSRSNFGFLPQRTISFGAFLIASSTRELGIFTIEREASTFAPFSASRPCTFLLTTFIPISRSIFKLVSWTLAISLSDNSTRRPNAKRIPHGNLAFCLFHLLRATTNTIGEVGTSLFYYALTT